MKILKYKKQRSGKYKIFLDNNTDLLLYEDTILKYGLLLKGELDKSELEDITNYNFECDVYNVALKLLNSRFRSIKELREKLIRKEYPVVLVNSTIDKLLKQGYLNDSSFCKSYINNQIITTYKGPNRIIKELINKGVSMNIINEEITVFTEEEQIIKMDKVISNRIKSNRNKGGIVLKNKVTNDLINLGYDINIINKAINNYNFKVDEDIYKKEYDKLYKKLSKKYKDKELEYKIKEKLFQKGLLYKE